MEHDIAAIWSDILSSSSGFLPPGTSEMWISECVPMSIEDGVLKLMVPNRFTLDNIEKRVLDTLSDYVRSEGHASSVELVLSDAAQKPAPAAKQILQPQSKNGLLPNYKFDTFVVGKSNNFAHAASIAVSESPGDAPHNPLFIWGGVGLGKTHLMHAIAHRILENEPSARILYVTSEKFTNDLVASIRNNTTQDFRARYRNLDVLLVDDIQFIGNKDATQEEFFHTFNSFREANRQVVISSDRPPKDIKDIEERLISRFEWGLVTYIQPPDFETRVAILQTKAELKEYRIPEDVITFIAQNIPSNIRELEGALNRVVMYSKINDEPINTDNIGSWLKDVIRSSTRGVSIDQIQQLTAESFNISIDDLTSSNRTKDVALARQIAMYIARERLNESLQQIAFAFNKKDHTTIIHACNKIEEMIKQNGRIKNIVENISGKL